MRPYYVWVHYQESGKNYGELVRRVIEFECDEDAKRYRREHDSNSFGVLVGMEPFEAYSKRGGTSLED